ncbi:MAG TPA: HD domain-containing protein [Gemmatimonadaceae bacterium]
MLPLSIRAYFDPDLERILAHVQQHLDPDAAHDVGHCLRVAEWTVRLAENAVPARLCIAAALLHDIVNIPKNHADRGLASQYSATKARELLADLSFDAADIDLVADAIRDHSFTRGAVPESTLGKALQDADRLEALGVIGTFRCIATGVRFGADFFDAFDPWATNRPLDDKRFSIDHFFVKLLRLPATFHTDAGRREAERRAAVMRKLLEALGEEIGQPAVAGTSV